MNPYPDFLLLNVGYASHDADWNFKDVCSPFSRLYYITDGYASVSINDRLHALSPGQMFHIPAFTCHTDICSGPFRHYYIHFIEDRSHTPGISASFDVPPCGILAGNAERQLFAELSDNMLQLRLKHPDPGLYDNRNNIIRCVSRFRELPMSDRMDAYGIIMRLMSRFIRVSPERLIAQNPRIAKAIGFMERNLHRPLSVEEAASEAGLSADHFTRLFRHETGTTPAQYIIREKILKAQVLTASEKIPVQEIAVALGYDDMSYFIRLFRKHTSMTPLQYRKAFNSGLP